MENSLSDWDKHSSLVMHKLTTHDKVLENITTQITQILVNQGKLEVKSGIWGVIGGGIPSLIAFLIWYLKSTSAIVLPVLKYTIPLIMSFLI